jgi:hypothetical protein
VYKYEIYLNIILIADLQIVNAFKKEGRKLVIFKMRV